MVNKLLKDIGLEKYLSDFKDVLLVETIVRKSDQILVLSFSSKEYLCPQVVDDFQKAVNKFFKSTGVVVLVDVDSKLNIEVIKSYFKYFSCNLNLAPNIMNILLNRELKYDSETQEVRLIVHNHFEFELVRDNLHKVESVIKNYGITAEFGCYENTQFYDLSKEDEELKKVALNMKKEEKNSEEEVKVVLDNTNLIYGKKIGRVTHKIKYLETDMSNVCVEGKIFSVESFVTRNNKVIVTILLSDRSNSATAKLFLDKNDKNLPVILGLKNKYVKISGHVTYDMYAKGDIIRVLAMSLEKENKVLDNAQDKRCELHIHTMMSSVDSVIDANKLVDFALENEYSAIGVVDHSSVQSFPTIFNATKKTDLKVLYGAEFNVVDSEVKLIFNNLKQEKLKFDDTYVVFDFETTGLNAFGDDRIIEVGAVKIKNGEIVDKFDELCNPGFSIGQTTTEITGIKNSMLLGKRSDKQVIKEFIDWIEDLPIVAQNAEFDFDFLSNAANMYGYSKIENSVLDTLTISRVIHPEWSRHGLAALTKRYKVQLENHHRALDDAIATAKIFAFQLEEIKNHSANIELVSDINNLVNLNDIHKFVKPFHITVYVQNQSGLKNLFKLISLCSTKYFHKVPLIPRSELLAHKEGLLFGSSCVNGEIFKNALKLSEIQLARLMDFYDFIEVQPVEVYGHLVDTEVFESKSKIEHLLLKIINVAKSNNKLVVASGDVHHLYKHDKILREIIINTPAPGGGLHPLKHSKITSIPSMHFRTTKEMLENFSFLGEELSYEIVVKNPKIVVDMTDDIQIIHDKLYTPKLEDSASKTEKMVYESATNIYGNNLPEIVSKRIEKELKSITGHGFDVIYLISSQLVKKSLDDGYLVGSRGSVGSSLVATFMDITEINPLSAHYICDYCKYSEFVDDDNYACGYDLPYKTCPKCSNELRGEGHDIPFETFLGFDGDKVPDIDLNFSGEYQSKAHDYTKVLFGEEYVYRAGTISTIAQKTAFGYVKGFEGDKHLSFNNAELTRLAENCIGVKRSTGQHPGGILVVPGDMDIHDFTPIQYPADDINSSWFTTHFDFHAIHDNILKLDILGHDDPTVLHMLSRISDIDSKNVDFTKPEVIEIFSSAKPLGVEPYKFELPDNKSYTIFTTGTLGVPEFGTRFVIEMLRDTQPKTFAELVKISGLSHGTDVWLNNGQYLIQNNICEFREIIGCRDDIMVYLMNKGLPQGSAFKIMEDVRKGKGLTEEYIELMKSHEIPEWYINSCNKIKYMFPKAHASAYVLMAMRIAYFKVFHPIYYYSAYFSIRCSDFDIMTMVRGKEAIIERIEDILLKGNEATTKEKSVQNTLEVALEMLERGFSFDNINLDTSHATEFIVNNKSLIPPFKSIDGLGENVAKKLMEERDVRPFMSIEDLKNRGKVNKTLLTKLEIMDVLEHLPEGDQLTLF